MLKKVYVMNYLKTLVSAALSGILIGIGATACLSTDNRILGALCFTVGLFVICIFGLNLFTGKVCYVFQNDKEYALRLPVIWVGNLIGTFITSSLISCTRGGAAVSQRAAQLCEIKLNDSYLSLIVLGIFCNVLIYIAVEGYNRAEHEIAKYLALFFGIVVFITCGFEHCIADMFYFSSASMWSSDALVRILLITLGNIIGGVFFPLVRPYIKIK